MWRCHTLSRNLATPPVTLWQNPCGPQWHENPLDFPLSQPISSGSANRTARHVEKSSIETPSVSFACEAPLLIDCAAMPHNLRLVRIFTTRTYERAVRKLMSEADRQKMEAAIVADPGRAPLLRGTGGIRKLRWAGSGRGKRGGIRTIYFHHAGPEAIYMLTAYAKADRDDLTPADRKTMSRLVAAIKKEETSR